MASCNCNSSWYILTETYTIGNHKSTFSFAVRSSKNLNFPKFIKVLFYFAEKLKCIRDKKNTVFNAPNEFVCEFNIGKDIAILGYNNYLLIYSIYTLQYTDYSHHILYIWCVCLILRL
jgi:hypothetical protein